MRRLAPTPDAEAACQRAVPLGRFGEREDIAELAIFLASEGARYITGAILNCDGGSSVSAPPDLDFGT